MQTKSRSLPSALPALMILLQSILYGFGDPISKAAYETTPLFTLLTLRYAMALAVLLALCGKRVAVHVRAVPLRTWLVPGMCIALCYVLNNFSLTLTEATSVAFLRSLATLLTPLLAFLVYRRRYDRRHMLPQILVLPGLYLLCAAGGLSGFGPGELISILSAIFMAGALVSGQDSLQRMDPLTLTTLQTGCSLVLALVCAGFFEGGVRFRGITPDVWAVIAYLALACTLAGYLLQNKALEKSPARSVALLQCIGPVMTAVFSYFLLGEHLTPAGLLGAGIIILCVMSESLLRD